MKYAKVIFDLPFDKILTYHVPASLENKAQAGARCVASVGKRTCQGFILQRVSKKPPFPTKPILEIPDDVPIFSKEMFEFTKELANYYFMPWIKVLKAALPPGLNNKKGLKSEPVVENNPDFSYNRPSYSLTEEQKDAVSQIQKSIDKQEHKIFLIHGITGSGKTEIYLESIFHSLKQKKGAIFLVPEISLTPQMIKSFKERFGKRLALYHSGLTPKQRQNEWLRIKTGRADIVLGVRSAIFAPVEKPGVIVIDESHETTYTQQEKFKYSAIQAAFIRAKIQKCVVLMGSATPSIETYYHAKKNKYKLIKLDYRIDNKQLPEIIVVDMNKEKIEGNKNIMSRRLKEAIQKTIRQGEQVILFLNRRGFSSVMMCKICGHIEKCKNCKTSLVYHSASNMLVCHHCNYTTDIPPICPRCNRSYLYPVGAGTQKVEREIKKISPHYIVQRMDSDIISKTKTHEQIFQSFLEGKTDILIGTQMLAKGLHFPDVTLVGIISADTQLSLPNFRAGEFTFQLLTQVAGRAGRGDKSGKVLVQTHYPEHYSIDSATHYDFEKFYENELSFRKQLNYPPFSQLVSLTIKGPSENNVRKDAIILANMLNSYISQTKQNFELTGPGPCPVDKIRNKYRWRIIIKSKNRKALEKLMQNLRGYWNKIPHTQESLSIDLDPVDMM
ncbi:MAG: primosomal protein N' [Candidatus Ratteibacteria bacterium]|nr:primosomal protein N' [Candidatus Ratteibacteria bacterium]